MKKINQQPKNKNKEVVGKIMVGVGMEENFFRNNKKKKMKKQNKKKKTKKKREKKRGFSAGFDWQQKNTIKYNIIIKKLLIKLKKHT